MSRWSASTTAPPAVSAEPSSAARPPTAAYLNQVRAGIARLPGDSEFTSAFEGIQGRAARQRGAGPAAASRFDGWLTPIQVEGDGQPPKVAKLNELRFERVFGSQLAESLMQRQ